MTGTRWIGAAVVMLALGGIGGCAGTGPTAARDGIYRGTATRFQVLRRTCPRPGLLSNVIVRGGVLQYRWEGQYIQASILANGTVSGALPGVRLSGTHDGAVISGTVTDGQCGLHFTLRPVAG